MIVAMDIGNTNIKAAVFEGSRLVKRLALCDGSRR